MEPLDSASSYNDNTMNKIVAAVAMMATVSFMSCGSSDSPEVDKSIMPSDSGKVAVAPASDAAMVAPQGNMPAVTQAVPSPQVISDAKTISADQAAKAMPDAGLNPAHGQPGHRCEIPVGAPLNSAPAAAQPQVQTVASSPQAITVPASAPTTAPTDPNAKLNPAHGQPGHDCAIPVGAPLKKS